MLENLELTGVAHVIQLSVAPVFLLSGIGAILAVMTNRLARIVDRARVLESRLAGSEGAASERIHQDLLTLARRARLISRAIALCTLTALLVCGVVITLFLGAFLAFNASLPVALFFVGAMLSFVLGLVWFLREIFLAAASLRIGPA
ncbi:MAG TPA: DUF2721 domain-containing protein [Solimonas sp.]|nr:DUF2721 domain-containing protein [Solimonas sp.]